MRSCKLLMIGVSLTLLSLGSSADSAPQRQAEIIHLLKHDCGSCHGMRLQGGLGPALNPERLKPFTAEQLAATILYGRPGLP